MTTRTLTAIDRYVEHLSATAGWIERSIHNGRGGSCAHFSLASGWSRPYPETTGYLIPTLARLHTIWPERGLLSRAHELGTWLLSIQNADGSWNGGLHPSRRPRASVFNTGQILLGLIALHRVDHSARWLDRALLAAQWLASGVDEAGLWRDRDYRATRTPSYYTHVAWPMLEVWRETHDPRIVAAAERVLRNVLARRRENGAFEGSGFGDGEHAFTHTIAYTLRGLLESARILDAWDDFGAPAAAGLERLMRKAELANGSLPGELDLSWNAVGAYTCLTGNAQTAHNLLLWERREPDLRIVNAAAKLVDRVCDTQSLSNPLGGVRGGVAGSQPVWGRYMTLRYPNWAAKFHCDALELLIARLEREAEPAACASF